MLLGSLSHIAAVGVLGAPSRMIDTPDFAAGILMQPSEKNWVQGAWKT